jgi:hypothetical protein
MTKINLKLCGLALLLFVVIAYKFAWPWAPWWVDLGMAILALIIILVKGKG